MIQCWNVAHDGIGDGDDGGRTAIVRGELEIRDFRKFLVEIEDIIDTGPTPTVDILGVVADDCDGGTLAMQGSDEVVLCLINVLLLIDEEPFDAGNPGLALRCLEEVKSLEWQLVDVEKIIECLWALRPENLLRQCMEGAAQNSLRANQGLETLTHHSGGVVSECKKDDLTCFRVCQKMRNSCSKCGGFAGAGGGKNTEILLGCLTDNTGLFVIECQ